MSTEAALERLARLDAIRWRHETHDDPETCWPECFELPEVMEALSNEPDCPGPDCPYCSGEMCARFDGVFGGGCQHDSVERHGYAPGEPIR